jgi:acetyl-CoA C-acetyltransferase
MSPPANVVVVAAARTPFGRFGGALRGLGATRLASLAIAETLRRSRIAGPAVDALYAGVGMIGANVLTATRQALLLGSGLPETVPSLGVDRACCSGLTAIGLAFRDIRAGNADAILCGGFESLSNTPFLWPRQRGGRPGPVEVGDPLTLRAEFLDKAIARYTGEEAVRMGVERLEQDEWAVASHDRYFAAEATGYFGFERFAVAEATATLAQDESPRADVSVAKLGTLKTVYDSPTVTAGNAPGLNDGAAFLMLTSDRFATAHGLAALARIVDYVQVANGPTTGSYTPAIALRKLLDRAGKTSDAIARIEINEAFAATPLVSTLFLADGDRGKAELLRRRTNMAGGAVAIGHPLGASGARLAMTLINGLTSAGGGLGAAAICGGFGQGDGLLLEVE